jgi:peroxiredoxin
VGGTQAASFLFVRSALMGNTLYLFACVLAIVQSPGADSSDGLLIPRLTRGLELYYRGSYTEEAAGTGVQFLRSYRLENRIFVIDSTPQEAEIACLTIWKQRNAAANPAEPETSSVRLELGRVDRQGRIIPRAGVSWLAPLDGPPSLECGALVEVPPRRLGRDDSWTITEENRPSRTWHVAGSDLVTGIRCVKLVGVQQSDDWDQPRADRTAWRRQDTLWLAPRGGHAYRVERIVERREPARREPTHRLVLKYELESSLQYPGQLYDDRRREIQQIQGFAEALTPLVPQAAQIGPRPFELILARIKHYSDSQPPTPYREALRSVQQLAEAGRRGESPPLTVAPESAPVAPVIALNRPAPDFLTTDLASRESARLHRWLGRPVLLVFYNPASALGEEVLLFAQKLQTAHADSLSVIGLAVSDDVQRALKQRDQLKLSFPLLSGTGLRLSYAIDATPKLVLIDSTGTVRGSYVGWGLETPHSITEDLKRWQTHESQK